MPTCICAAPICIVFLDKKEELAADADKAAALAPDNKQVILNRRTIVKKYRAVQRFFKHSKRLYFQKSRQRRGDFRARARQYVSRRLGERVSGYVKGERTKSKQ